MASKITYPLVVIVGETASGKSDLAMYLAEQFDGEIISADSRAIYKGMDIGTAKPSKGDQVKIRHHLIDIINPSERYSVKRFKEDALKAIADIGSRNKLPIMVGGTGLYVDAVLFNYKFKNDTTKRNPKNLRHVLPSSFQGRDKELRGNTLIISLLRSKEELQKRIIQRVDKMLENGLEKEVASLVNMYGSNIEPLSGTGYRAFVRCINGEIDTKQAKVEFIRGDMALAKRQKTWFKRNNSIHYITKRSKAVELVTTLLNTNL